MHIHYLVTALLKRMLVVYLCALWCLSVVTVSMEIEIVNKKMRAFGTTSGVAVTDLDGDGYFEVIIAVYDGPNRILKFDWKVGDYIDIAELNPAFTDILDSSGNAVSVCACDIDGDGWEEIYIHNDNLIYPVQTQTVPDRLFKYINGKYMDIFSMDDNNSVAPRYGGTSVACIDRTGRGIYDVIINTFTPEGIGTYSIISMDSEKSTTNRTILKDISDVFGTFTGKAGQGILVGALLANDTRSHVFITNDNMYQQGSSFYRHDASNLLLKNNEDGIFTDIALDLGISDHTENGRGAVVTDLNEDGNFDLVYANWHGPTRVFVQDHIGQFQNVEDPEFCFPSASDFLLVIDLNNDGYIDLVKSRSGDGITSHSQNQLYTIEPYSDSSNFGFVEIEQNDTSALKHLQIQGIAAADVDNDGLMEILVSHNPYNQKTFSVLSVNHSTNNWLRIMPLTKHGAPARGSVVTLTLGDNERRVVIGGDCSYLCQSEPVAHFGLGQNWARELSITWPNGHKIRRFLYKSDHKQTLIVHYSGLVTYKKSGWSGHSVVSASDVVRTTMFILTLLPVIGSQFHYFLVVF